MKRPLSLVGTTLALAAGRSSDHPNAQRRVANDFFDLDDDDDATLIVPVPPAADSSVRQRDLHRPHPSYLQQQPQASSPSLRGGGGQRQLQSHTRQRRRLYHAPDGTFHNLVLLLRFSDHVNRTLPTQADLSRLYNSEEAPDGSDEVVPTGSVRQVFHANSHGTFTVNTTVADWITLNHTEAYYSNGNHGFPTFKEAIMEGLEMMDARGFNFTEFDLDEDGALDGFGVMHSGFGAEYGGVDCYTEAENTDRIWSHKGRLHWTSGGSTAEEGDDIKVNRYYVSSAMRGRCHSNIVRMGVICHELGHYLGIPDLYDNTFQGSGLGAFDFMAHSWGWDGSGRHPPNLSAWSKMQVGWVDVITIDSDGTYQLESSETSNRVYKIQSGYPAGEYLLIENRQPKGYDSDMRGSGLAIYHVDETARGQKKRGYPDQTNWPENGNHYKVAMLAADGGFDLERGENRGDSGDLWHSGSLFNELKSGPGAYGLYPNTDRYQGGNVYETGVRIYNISESGDTMSFTVVGIGPETGGLPQESASSVQEPDGDTANDRVSGLEQSGEDESVERVFAFVEGSPEPTASPTPRLKRTRNHVS